MIGGELKGVAIMHGRVWEAGDTYRWVGDVIADTKSALTAPR